MDKQELFREIEKLDLHLQEPRFECQVRAHYVGKFLISKGIKAGRIWAMPAAEGGTIVSPLRDANGNSFRALVTDVDADGKSILCEDAGQPLTWKYHVAACDVSDWYNAVVYDPAMFDGPVPLRRWMAAFGKENAPRFILTQWNTGPKYNWAGSSYTPDLQHEHGPDDNQRAAMDLMILKGRSHEGVRYQRLSASNSKR